MTLYDEMVAVVQMARMHGYYDAANLIEASHRDLIADTRQQHSPTPTEIAAAAAAAACDRAYKETPK